MYTWSYIKQACLGKLNLTEGEAEVQGFLDLFPIYANEVMTQICSSVKPKYTFVEFEITDELVNKPQTMPDDFVSFGDDVCYEIKTSPFTDKEERLELFDDDFKYHGYNQIIFNHTGKFVISYNARWFTFGTMESRENDLVIPVPADILDCIPSYVAAQCFKIDDEYKASVFRNEYEIMLSRIDNTNYKNTKTFFIGGDW